MDGASEHFGELWVIEAPGKSRGLESALRRLGMDARVFATNGHLLSHADRLQPLGIDADWREPGRVPREPERVARLRAMAARAGRVVIATDADQEGDVIAWDVAEALSDLHPSTLRVRLRGLDDESILAAADEAMPVSREDAVPGRARAMVDRILGATFSGDGVAVGRVGTAMLGLFAPGQPPMTTLRLRLSAPCAEGGKPWVADAAALPPLSRDSAERLAALSLPALRLLGVAGEETRPPGHTGDILLRASDMLGMSPSEAMGSLQRNYEAGRMSYPRSASRALTDAAAARIDEIVRRANQRFDAGRVARKGESDVHDAPHPVGPAPELSRDPTRLDPDEGLRVLVARDLVRSGQVQVMEAPDLSPVRSLLEGLGIDQLIVEAVCAMPWRREKGPRYPGQESYLRSETYERLPAAVLLERVIEAGLGRPSTWANHVEGFLSRGLVDAEMRLTEKGRRWMAASPQGLLNPRVSAAVERAFEVRRLRGEALLGEEPWETVARRIVTALPPELRVPALEVVAQTVSDPGPRRDPWVALRLTAPRSGLPEPDAPDLGYDAPGEGLAAPAPPSHMFPED